MTPLQQLVRQISYSSLNEFRTCERKYVLDKASLSEKSTNIDFAFGSAVASACQTLWLTDSVDQGLLAIFRSWDTDFFEEKPRAKKAIFFAVQALRNYLPFYQIFRREWELATIDGKPCIEFSLKIELPDGFLYRAYADLILRNIESGELAVNEFKTDGSSFKQEAKYRNSDQGTSYSLLVDQLAPDTSSFWVNYPVYYSPLQEWEFYSFPKTLVNKAKWLRTTLGDIRHIKECEEGNYWPMRGGSCLQYNKPCRYFETCTLVDKALFASEEFLADKVKKEQEKEYSFVIPIEKIVANYLK